ncbi:hypothetical protein [Chitinimonas sp. BJB300]|uniref:hypothetical protein n=1 Tax=Chitinimonas sp. BJB300 TaxID=1559339 RepID=UPI00130463CD|nr:hypothetical protein [Chitinimonas sp. BJB300]
MDMAVTTLRMPHQAPGYRIEPDIALEGEQQRAITSIFVGMVLSGLSAMGIKIY